MAGRSGTAAGRALWRWAVVAVVGALLVGVPALLAARPGDAQADPQELRDRIAASAGVGWTGYAEARATLGLPRIAALADVTTLLSGVTRMRGWYASVISPRSSAPCRADSISIERRARSWMSAVKNL